MGRGFESHHRLFLETDISFQMSVSLLFVKLYFIFYSMLKGGQESRNCCTRCSTSNMGRCMATGALRLSVRILLFRPRRVRSYSLRAFSSEALKARFSLGNGGTRRVRNVCPWWRTFVSLTSARSAAARISLESSTSRGA